MKKHYRDNWGRVFSSPHIHQQPLEAEELTRDRNGNFISEWSAGYQRWLDAMVWRYNDQEERSWCHDRFVLGWGHPNAPTTFT